MRDPHFWCVDHDKHRIHRQRLTKAQSQNEGLLDVALLGCGWLCDSCDGQNRFRITIIRLAASRQVYRTIFYITHLAVMGVIHQFASKKRSGTYRTLYDIISLMMMMMMSKLGRRNVILVLCFSSVSSITTMHMKSSRYPTMLSHRNSHVLYLIDDQNGDVFEDPVVHDDNNSRNDDGTSSVSQSNRTGYRRIEDWHEETYDPTHVIKHLKQEKAKWAKTFEGLGGDGI